jgi:hypothetical protein
MDEDITPVPHAIGGREELTGGEVLAYLGSQGYAAESEALMAAARKFPGACMYTADRHRYAAYIMPRGYWRAGDCEKSEERIKAAPRRRW